MVAFGGVYGTCIYLYARGVAISDSGLCYVPCYVCNICWMLLIPLVCWLKKKNNIKITQQERKCSRHEKDICHHFFFPFGCWVYLASSLAKKFSDWAARVWFLCCMSIVREASVSSSFSFLASFAASLASAAACGSQKANSETWQCKWNSEFPIQ